MDTLNVLDTTQNYQSLAQAIVLKAIEDAQGCDTEAQEAYKWLMKQGVLALPDDIIMSLSANKRLEACLLVTENRQQMNDVVIRQ